MYPKFKDPLSNSQDQIHRCEDISSSILLLCEVGCKVVRTTSKVTTEPKKLIQTINDTSTDNQQTEQTERASQRDMRSTIALLYVLAGPTGTSGFGIGDVQDFVTSFFFSRRSDSVGNDAPGQQCLRHDGFGGCDGGDSIWEVFHEFEEIVDEEGIYGECCVEILVASCC